MCFRTNMAKSKTPTPCPPASRVGPELSSLKDNERAKFIAATDAEAFIGFRLLSQLEGIIPALETAHAVYGAVELAKTMKKGEDIVICLSGEIKMYRAWQMSCPLSGRRLVGIYDSKPCGMRIANGILSSL